MTLPPAALALQAQLRTELLSARPAILESLAARLIGTLLGIQIANARPGYQHGADAGPAGRSSRHFRVECKLYRDSGTLSDRELLGEIDQALDRNPALEAWVLIATCRVAEQTQESLNLKADRIGVPVLVIDWHSERAAALAALCTVDADAVSQLVSSSAGNLTRQLATELAPLLESLRRELSPWFPGFESLRRKSRLMVLEVWNRAEASIAQLAQDVAGGARPARVRRHAAHSKLQDWWNTAPAPEAAAAVVGTEGVGKTWAVMDWLVETIDSHPIVVLVPASAAACARTVTVTSVSQFLGERLYELTRTRTAEHWTRRLELMLQRPASDGPLLTILFDGLNQHATVPWMNILTALQSEPFAGRVRVIITTRPHHFRDKLSDLLGLRVRPVHIPVEPYDLSPNGELDQMLAFERLGREALHPDLLDLARIPRLFHLVIRFRERLVEADQVTVHRLLWEYGRDTFGRGDGSTFSELQWREWLAQVARDLLQGVRTFSSRALAAMADRADLDKHEVYSRLSTIVDGRFAEQTGAGELRLTPTIVSHALGAALLWHLDEVASTPGASISETLAKWLDPIAGLDQRSEVLRAAASIFVERGDGFPASVGGPVVTAWLQSQNLPDSHRTDMMSLAPWLSTALLDAVEGSADRAHSAARECAVRALRSIPPSNRAAVHTIISRARTWFCTVPRRVDSYAAHEDIRRARAERWRSRVGTDSIGSLRVLGLDLTLVESRDASVELAAIRVLGAFPLEPAVPVMEAAAIAFALAAECDGWEALKWTCLLNEKDPDLTAVALRRLAAEVRDRHPESGVHPDLAARAASLLLRLSGDEQDEAAAAELDPQIDRILSYERDYLPDPGASWFALERRHASSVLADDRLPTHLRVRRSKELMLDPTFSPPDEFRLALVEHAQSVDLDRMDQSRGKSAEELAFEQMEPALARCAPHVLAAMVRERLRSIKSCTPDEAYWRALRAPHHLLLTGESEKAAASAGRTRGVGGPTDDRCFVITNLLMMEIHDLDAFSQFERLVCADLEPIYTSVEHVLRVPTMSEIDRLVERFADGPAKQQRDLLYLLSTKSLKLSDNAWAWTSAMARSSDNHIADMAFEILADSDPIRLGKTLQNDSWGWSERNSHIVNHYGSLCLIEATRSLPFEQVVARVTPSSLCRAVRIRGEQPDEARLAAQVLERVLMAPTIPEPDLGAEVSVATDKGWPFTLSIAARRPPLDGADSVAALQQALDPEARSKSVREAAAVAVERINEVRKAGGDLYLAASDSQDISVLVRQAWPIVAKWFEGMAERTSDFTRRVALAESTYLASCEALLTTRPEIGVQLWRTLRDIMSVRYVGRAGVDVLVHALFRAPDSAPVAQLRQELLRPPLCTCDRDLFDAVIAAQAADRIDVIDDIVRVDRASPLPWQRRRGEVLAGFSARAQLPAPGAWPDGPIVTSHADLRRSASRSAWSDACARHWWSEFLHAADPAVAYAAWILFLEAADRRAWIWMQPRTQSGAGDNGSTAELGRRNHAGLNRSQIDRAMERREDKAGERFLFRKRCEHVFPWATD